MKLIYSLIFIVCILLFPAEVRAQQSDLQAGLYNVGLGSVIGGIGAIINKKPEEHTGKVFLKGLGTGAVGGYLVFESKRLVRLFSRSGNYAYVWPSKLVNAAGNSVIENAASNRPAWERWHLSFGFNRIEISAKEDFSIRYRIMPSALVGTVITATRGRFDPGRTLKTGSFVFTTSHIRGEDPYLTKYGQVPLFGNSILILDTWEGEHALSHEIIHTYQNESFIGINTYLNKTFRKFTDQSPSFRIYNRIFYTDLNALVFGALYNLESLGREGYSGNLFEQEAFYFTGTEMKNPGGGPVLF